jgi:LAGLIDADG DNA endonuclease family/Phage terminase large subunit (GpA)/Intein splicing domain
MNVDQINDNFKKLRESILSLDPVAFVEHYLTMDGKEFRLTNNGYKPFCDIYRYIGIKALEPNSKPVVMVKGRQVGGTTMASALEMYFMGCNIFGVNGKPPIRVIHAFPQLDQAAAYTKTKLNAMISNSIPMDAEPGSKKKVKSFMQSMLDTSNPSNDSLQYKQFVGGNHIWIESTGLDGSRLRGRTADVIFFDECICSDQKIVTDNGKISLIDLYNRFIKNEELPLLKTLNEETNQFELKKIKKIWCNGEKELITIFVSGRKIECTDNHRFLTENGWEEIKNIEVGSLLKSSKISSLRKARALNDDQYQLVLGSFLGDGSITNKGKSRYVFRFTHGAAQIEYCSWKAQMFHSSIRHIKENGFSKKPAVVFSSKVYGINKEFPKTKTTCPQWVLDEIDARGIAIWFMDDGSLNKRWGNNASATLSTCSFDEDSQVRIVEKFKSLGIECHYKKYDGYFSIYFNKDGFRNLSRLIAPYTHENLDYKILETVDNKYVWSNAEQNFDWLVLSSKEYKGTIKPVYDLEMEDNHNFILAPNKKSMCFAGPIVHNCQQTSGMAITNSTKMLAQAKYGKTTKGVQVLFGTPLRQGSDFHRIWKSSTQQFYHLGCEGCKKYFPLYTPGTDDWEKVWVHGKIVQCTHCGLQQQKDGASERGKWIAMVPEEDAQYIGFHINQLYMPNFTKEDIIAEKPGIHPINTERAYRNEVLGEFFQGDSSPITVDEIREKCGDVGRRGRAQILPSDNEMVVMGIDYGAKSDLDQMANPEKNKSGQSYTCAVILVVKGPHLLSIERAIKFKKNDMDSKKSQIDQLMRQYSVQLTVGDIGFSNDFSTMLHTMYGDKYLVSRAISKVNNHMIYNQKAFPKELQFEKAAYYSEVFEKLKRGEIKFPFGDYDRIDWLVTHCANMEIKPILSRTGDPSINYIKSGANDGFCALVNAYIAYKFMITAGFSQIANAAYGNDFRSQDAPLAILGNMPRMARF